MEKKHLKILIILIIIGLALEVIVFNITSYRILFGNYEKKVFTDFEFLKIEDGNTYLKISNINQKVGTIKLELKDIEEPVEYKFYYSDDTTEYNFGLNSKFYLLTSEKSHYIPVYLSGDTNYLILSVNNYIYEEGKLESVTINEKIPFEFNIVRFIIVTGILIFIYFYKTSEIFKKEYSNKDIKQETVLLIVIAIFFVITSYVNTYSDSQESMGNDFLGLISTNEGVYNKAFVNSIMNGKLYLLSDPTPELAELTDPYDSIARESTEHVRYEWDTAYYNGHSYIYFGILPLIITFLPYFYITNRYLKVSVVVFAFSMLIFIVLKEILTKILKKYFKEVPFKNVFLFLVTLCSGTLIIYANGISRVYEVVIIVGLYFVLQGIYFILKSQEKDKDKYLYIFFGSLSLALSVACRPTDLLASLLVLPYFISLLITNIRNFKNNKKSLFKLIFSIGIPYLIVGILLMIYNYVRFDNPFEFGARYQLTVNNMNELGSRIFTIPMVIFCNFFNIPVFGADFPFILNNNNILNFYGYYYIENMLGGLFLLVPICLFCFYVVKANKKIENKNLKILINSLIIVGLIIAIISGMMGGSNQRYLIDYAWMFILAGILIFSSLYNILKSKEAKLILQKILGIITVYTFIVGILCGIVSEKSYMQNYSKEEFYKLKYTVCFWE